MMKISTLALAGLFSVFTASAFAADASTSKAVTAPAPMVKMTHAEHEAAEKTIKADFKADKAACKKMTGTERKSCKKDAVAKEKAAKADLKAKKKM
jgi:hypothetical protein